MTVAELIEVLKSLPPDAPLARSCGGDCIGYTKLFPPLPMTLYPNPESEREVYGGDLMSESDYQAHKRCEAMGVEAMRADVACERECDPVTIEQIHRTVYPLPEGKTYMVF